MSRQQTLFIFGLGYSAEYLTRGLIAEGWTVHGTTRDAAKAARLQRYGVMAHLWEGEAHQEIQEALSQATHLLVSLPPGEVDEVARQMVRKTISDRLAWVGYLSATSVYGDHGGGWVDETTPPSPIDTRGEVRLKAEDAWQEIWGDVGIAGHIFRLSGIYGPGRSVLDRLRAGTARRIVREGHYFSRIHVEDIAGVAMASMQQSRAGDIYNLADDQPAPSHELIDFACELTGMTPPVTETFETAEMSEMMRSFYAANRRIKNEKIKLLTGGQLRYPDYRAGLRAIWHETCK